jgi:hypothetical protein
MWGEGFKDLDEPDVGGLSYVHSEELTEEDLVEIKMGEGEDDESEQKTNLHS